MIARIVIRYIKALLKHLSDQGIFINSQQPLATDDLWNKFSSFTDNVLIVADYFTHSYSALAKAIWIYYWPLN